MDYIDLALSLPVAPQNVTLNMMPHISSLPSVPFSESDGQARFRKEIVRDGQNGDFLMLLDNEPVGFARNYSEADTTLDELIFTIRYADTPGTDCPSCGDLLCEDAAVCAACRESGEMMTTPDPSDGAPHDPQTPGESPGGGGGRATVAPTHCQYLAACDDHSCSACSPTMKELGAAHFATLHDDPIGFLRQFDGRDVHDREAIVIAIAAWGGEAAEYVGSFIAETRNRAMILEMLN
jgi:hypothetical protein